MPPTPPIPTTWFTSKIAPGGDTNHNEGGCHPLSASALQSYLSRQTTPPSAAQAITHPMASSPDPADELHHLWGLLYDAFTELPLSYIDCLVDLLAAIENLPNPPSLSLDTNPSFWKESPGFANIWADMSPSYAWRGNAVNSTGTLRADLRELRIRRADVEARLVRAGLAGITLDWGYEVVADALECSSAILDFEGPAAERWMAICGESFKQGAERGEESWGLRQSSGPTRDLWDGEDGLMGWGRWRFWEESLRVVLDMEEVRVVLQGGVKDGESV